jgi:Coenzyme PQQ synthesis protein D (PqqD)
MTETPPITWETVLTRRMDIRIRRFHGTLYVTVEDRTIKLEEIAENSFRRVDGKASVQDIASSVAEIYDAPLQEVRDDCMELFEQLLVQGVVGIGSIR